MRGNVGGRIHDMLITILIKKQYAYSTSRRRTYEPRPEPYSAWDKPSIVLVDEHSFSDGEIFPIVYQQLKLGKVVGFPSSGAVIGTWEYSLVDGSSMRLPVPVGIRWMEPIWKALAPCRISSSNTLPTTPSPTAILSCSEPSRRYSKRFKMPDQQLTNTILRAEALMKSNWIHGLNLLEKAVKDYPEDPRPYMSLAEFYIRRQLFDKAIKNLQTASKLAPQNDGIKYLLGNCYFATGDYRTAIVYYDMIKNPFTDVQYNKTLALAHLGETNQCIALTKELLNKVDNLPFLYFLLVEQLLRLSEYEEALAYIRRAEQKWASTGT